MKTENQLKSFMVVERSEDDKLFVEEAQIVAHDIMGTNGVLHIIDEVLIPNQGMLLLSFSSRINRPTPILLKDLSQLSVPPDLPHFAFK